MLPISYSPLYYPLLAASLLLFNTQGSLLSFYHANAYPTAWLFASLRDTIIHLHLMFPTSGARLPTILRGVGVIVGLLYRHMVWDCGKSYPIILARHILTCVCFHNLLLLFYYY